MASIRVEYTIKTGERVSLVFPTIEVANAFANNVRLPTLAMVEMEAKAVSVSKLAPGTFQRQRQAEARYWGDVKAWQNVKS